MSWDANSMFKKLLHGKRKSALLNLTWSGLLCRVVWSVSQLLYLLQRAGHFKFFSPSFFVGLELTAGEFPIIIYSDIARTEELKRKGAPIEWVTAEPHITVLVSAGITREARHPAAARLFMNYLAADEGQKAVIAMDKPPALPKFQPEYLRGVKLYPADWVLSDTYEEYNKLYRDIFWTGK